MFHSAFVASMRVSAVDECHGLVYWSNECFTVRSYPVWGSALWTSVTAFCTGVMNVSPCVRSQYEGQRCGRVSRPAVLE